MKPSIAASNSSWSGTRRGWLSLFKKKSTAMFSSRLTASAMPYPDTTPFARALVDAAPERLLWGSDWPHVFIKTAMPNDGDLFDVFAKWVPDAAMRQRILVDHPALVYDFPN